MKIKILNKKIIILLLCALLFCNALSVIISKNTLSASPTNDIISMERRREIKNSVLSRETHFKNINVTINIKDDFTAEITEFMEIDFKESRTAVIRDLPVNNKLRYENINSPDSKVSVSKYEEFLSVDLDSGKSSTGVKTFTLNYTMVMPYTEKHGDSFSINAIWFSRYANVAAFTVTVNNPTQIKNDDYFIFFGSNSSSKEFLDISYSNDNKTAVIKLKDDLFLYDNEGLTVDYTLEAGTFVNAKNNLPVYLIAITVILFIVSFVLYNTFKNINKPVPVINFTAPEGLDPAEIGYLIDGFSTPDDITSLIFYFASQEYLSIEILEKKNRFKQDEIVLHKLKDIKLGKPHQTRIFNALFASGDSVVVSSLAEKFSGNISSASMLVTRQYKGRLFNKNSIYKVLALFAIPVLFTTIGVFTDGLTIFKGFIYIYGIFIVIPAILLLGINWLMFSYSPKWYGKKKGKVISFIASLVICALFAAIASAILITAPKFIIAGSVLLFFASIWSLNIFEHKKYYSNLLNQILGFKIFIETAEKERLEAMLKDNPQFYYEILPYANVLGISEIWMDKFKGLTIEPPNYLRSYTFVDYLIFRSIYNSAFNSINKTLTSVPQNTSSNFKSGGGFGGGSGFGGGGFGGGGSRFR